MQPRPAMMVRKGGGSSSTKGTSGLSRGVAVAAPLVQEQVAVREGQGIQVRHLAADDALGRRLAVAQGGQELGEGDLALVGDDVVKVGDGGGLGHVQGGVRPADDDDACRAGPP